MGRGMGVGATRGWWSATLHGHRRGWPHGRSRPGRARRTAADTPARSIFVDDGRRARWGLLLGYGTGTILVVWVVLVAGSVVGSDWLSGADVPRSGDGSRHEAFESPSRDDQGDTTAAAARRRSSGGGSAFGGIQALTVARATDRAPAAPSAPQPSTNDDADRSAGAERPAGAPRPTVASSDGSEELAAATGSPAGGAAATPVVLPDDETTDEAALGMADEEAGSFDGRAPGLDGPTRSAP